MGMTKTVDLGPDGAKVRYLIGFAPAKDALAAGARVLNALGPAIEGMRGGFTGAVGGLMANPDLGRHLQFLCDTFAPYTQVVFENGKSATLSSVAETHFRGKLGLQLQWLAEAVEWNLSDFLGVAKAQFDAAKAKALAAAGPAGSPSNPPKPAETTG